MTLSDLHSLACLSCLCAFKCDVRIIMACGILWLYCSHGSICLAVNKPRSRPTVTKCHNPCLTSGISLTRSSNKTQFWARCCSDGLFMSSLCCHLVYLVLYLCVFLCICRLLPLSWAQLQPYSARKPVVGLCWEQGSANT